MWVDEPITITGLLASIIRQAASRNGLSPKAQLWLMADHAGLCEQLYADALASRKAAAGRPKLRIVS